MSGEVSARCASLAARARSSSSLFGKHWRALLCRVVGAVAAAPGQGAPAGLVRPVVVDLFRELGATFIKVGQIMSTRPDLIPEYISTRARASCRTTSAPSRSRTSCAPSKSDLGRPVERVFAEFAPGAARVGVGVAGPQGAPARRAHRRGQGAPPERRRAVHVRSGRDARLGARCWRWCRRSRPWRPSSERRGVRARRLRAARFPHRGPQQPPLPRELSQASRRSSSPRSSTPLSTERILTMTLHRRDQDSVDAADALRPEAGGAPGAGRR